MSILDKIQTTQSSAPIITLYGKPGIGKSTLASEFPDPLFLLTENPELPGIRALPVASSFEEIWSMAVELSKLEKPPFKTLVIDSISKLDNLIVDYILQKEEEGRKTSSKMITLSSSCGGYGAGYDKAKSIHLSFNGVLNKLKAKGVTVIYIAHLAIAKHRSPDQEDYDTYSINMNHDKSRAVYIDGSDLVGFCRLRSFTTDTESGRTLIKSSEDRVVVVGINDANVSKNRFNMPTEIKMNANEIIKHIPFYNVNVKEK